MLYVKFDQVNDNIAIFEFTRTIEWQHRNMNAQDIVNPVRGARVSYCGIIMHAPLGALEPSQTHVEHADPIPTVPNYFTRELECPWVSISVHHSYRHHPRTPCSVWYPQPEIALGRKL